MMTDDQRRANIRELVELLDVERNRGPFGCWCMSVGDACEFHERAGLLSVYDTALPQGWWDAFYGATGDRPAGIVWSYDAARTFGAPYALTASAQVELERFQRLQGSAGWAR